MNPGKKGPRKKGPKKKGAQEKRGPQFLEKGKKGHLSAHLLNWAINFGQNKFCFEIVLIFFI